MLGWLAVFFSNFFYEGNVCFLALFYNWDSNDHMDDGRVSGSQRRWLAAQAAPGVSSSVAGSANRPKKNHWIMWGLYIWPRVHVAACVACDAPNKENKWLGWIRFFCVSPPPLALQKLFTHHTLVIRSGRCAIASSFMHAPYIFPSTRLLLLHLLSVELSLKVCVLHEPFDQRPVCWLRSGPSSRGWADGGRALAAQRTSYSC